MATSRVTGLYQGAAYLGTSLGALVTAAANQRIRMDKVTMTNHDTATRTVTVQIIPSGQSAANNRRVILNREIASNETVDFYELRHVLNPGDSIQALASVAGVITPYISGVVFT